jgi:hypothetical protein
LKRGELSGPERDIVHGMNSRRNLESGKEEAEKEKELFHGNKF